MLSHCTQGNKCWKDANRTGVALIAHSSLYWQITCPLQFNIPIIELTQLPALQPHYLRFCPLPPSVNFFHIPLPTFHCLLEQKKGTSNKSTSLFVIPPQRVKDSSVGEDADEPVLHSDIVEERLFGVHNERVRDPEQLHEPPVEAQALVALKHQALVRPALTEEYGGGVVLQDLGSKVTTDLMDCFNKYVNNLLTNKWGVLQAKLLLCACISLVSLWRFLHCWVLMYGIWSLSPSVPEATVIPYRDWSQQVCSAFQDTEHILLMGRYIAT